MDLGFSIKAGELEREEWLSRESTLIYTYLVSIEVLVYIRICLSWLFTLLLWLVSLSFSFFVHRKRRG